MPVSVVDATILNRGICSRQTIKKSVDLFDSTFFQQSRVDGILQNLK
jgi:hypothetical protein